MTKKTLAISAVMIIIIAAGALAYTTWNTPQNEGDISVLPGGQNATTTDQVDQSGNNQGSQPQTPGTVQGNTYTNTQHGISFTIPQGYKDTTAERSSLVPIVTFEKPEYAIAVKSITPKAGQTYEQALIEDVIFDGSGDHPQSFNQFQTRTIGGRTYHWIVTGRFEAVVAINYYLKRDNDILAFSSQSRNVFNWTDENFKIDDDVAHKDLRTMLGTLKLSTPVPNTVTLYFTDTKSPQFATSCAVTASVTRQIPRTVAVADAALRELFKGPTAAEKAKGYTMDVNPTHYLGVTVVNGVAKVNFKKEALVYLNGAACQQESVKTAIEQTLKQFSSVKSVQYAIDGNVFTEWDA